VADFDTIRDSVGNALSAALVGESEMVTRWTAIVEVMDADGERACYLMAPEGAKAWDTLGLLTFATQVEQARAVGGDDDE
jgi:hypothetical protein